MERKLKIHILYNHVVGAEKETSDMILALEFVKYLVQMKLPGLVIEFIYFDKSTLLGQRKFKFFEDLTQADIILVVITPGFLEKELAKIKKDAAFNERIKKKEVIPLMVGTTDVPDVFSLDEKILFFDISEYRQQKKHFEVLRKTIMISVEGISSDNFDDNAIDSDSSGVRDRFADGTDKKCYRPDNLLKALEPVITADKKKYHDVEACLKKNCNYHQLEFDGTTPANGNCLFEAVSVQLDRTPEDLRQSVVNYLRHNRAYQGLDEHVQFENFVEGNFDDYLDNMSRDGEWGDHVIVVGLSQMLHRNIAIITSSPETAQEDSMILVMGDNSYKSKPLLLGHYWENHYQSLKPIENEYTDVSDDGPSTDMDNRKETKNELFKQKDTSMKEQSKSLGITPEEGTSNDRTRNKNTLHKQAHPQETVPVNMVICSDDGSHTKTENVTNTSEQQKTKHVMGKGEGKPLGGVRINEKTDMTDNEKARERRNINFSENQSNSVMKETKKTLNQEQKTEDISQMAPITKNILDRDCRKEKEKAGDEVTILYANDMQEEEICSNLKSENQSNSVKKDSKEPLNQEQKNGNMMQIEQETNTPYENRQNEMENADDQETIQQDEMHNCPNNENQSNSVKKDSKKLLNQEQKNGNMMQIEQETNTPDGNRQNEVENTDAQETIQQDKIHNSPNNVEEVSLVSRFTSWCRQVYDLDSWI